MKKLLTAVVMSLATAGAAGAQTMEWGARPMGISTVSPGATAIDLNGLTCIYPGHGQFIYQIEPLTGAWLCYSPLPTDEEIEQVRIGVRQRRLIAAKAHEMWDRFPLWVPMVVPDGPVTGTGTFTETNDRFFWMRSNGFFEEIADGQWLDRPLPPCDPVRAILCDSTHVRDGVLAMELGTCRLHLFDTALNAWRAYGTLPEPAQPGAVVTVFEDGTGRFFPGGAAIAMYACASIGAAWAPVAVPGALPTSVAAWVKSGDTELFITNLGVWQGTYTAPPAAVADEAPAPAPSGGGCSAPGASGNAVSLVAAIAILIALRFWRA